MTLTTMKLLSLKEQLFPNVAYDGHQLNLCDVLFVLLKKRYRLT